MASSSTSIPQKSYQFDVFLSFRGADTRMNFVDHLYESLQDRGIRTFRDDEGLERGTSVKDGIFKSIDDSKFCIIVFSENYASSSWCLDELVKIIKSHKDTAYPVFYHVDPSDVRKQSGPVGKAFARLAHKDAAREWREALTEAANLKGWDLWSTAYGHEAKIVKLIVEMISLNLRSLNEGIDKEFVGMERRMKDLDSYLEIGSNDVRMIGIKGMGGAGKTALARAIFYKLSLHFDAISFVEDVREVLNKSSLRALQEKVLSALLKEKGITIDSVYDGKMLMRGRLSSKKILLVLDDVDHIEQLEALAGGTDWFLPGSRIIITTRDESVLIAHQVNWIYDVNLLSDEEAIRLFSRHAFGSES